MLAPADKQTRQDLQRYFGEEILKVKLPLQEREPVTYEMEALLDRDFAFSLEPEDKVETVKVKRLRLRVMGTIKRSVILEADSITDPKAVYNLLDDLMRNSDLGAEMLQLTGVGVQLIFKPNERGKRRTLTFDVGYPNACSLHEGDPRHDVAVKLLKRWDIDVSARTKQVPASRRGKFQRSFGL